MSQSFGHRLVFRFNCIREMLSGGEGGGEQRCQICRKGNQVARMFAVWRILKFIAVVVEHPRKKALLLIFTSKEFVRTGSFQKEKKIIIRKQVEPETAPSSSLFSHSLSYLIKSTKAPAFPCIWLSFFLGFLQGLQLTMKYSEYRTETLNVPDSSFFFFFVSHSVPSIVTQLSFAFLFL